MYIPPVRFLILSGIRHPNPCHTQEYSGAETTRIQHNTTMRLTCSYFPGINDANAMQCIWSRAYNSDKCYAIRKL